MKTLVEISKVLNITDRAVSLRFEKAGIKGIKRGLRLYFNQSQIDMISFRKNKIARYPLLSSPIYYHRQVEIIETYLALDFKNISEVSRILEIPLSVCERTLRYFKNRDCLIIQSKMNRLELEPEQELFEEFKKRVYGRKN